MTLLTEPLSLVLILGLLLALDARRVLLAGALCGLLVLARPSAQGIAVVVGLWVLWSFGLRRCLQFVGLAIVVVAPWIVRNWVQIGSPVLVTSNGFNLAAMYSPAAEATGAFVDPVYDPSFDKLRLAQFDEVGWQRDLQHMAITNLEAHPRQPASVFARNSAAFFELRPSFNRTAEVEDGRNLLFVTWTLPLFYVMTVVGLAGVVLLWRRHRTRSLATLMILATAYFTFASLFLVAPPRLRAPFDLLCCIGFGVTVDAALRRWAPGEQQRAGSAPRPHRRIRPSAPLDGSDAGTTISGSRLIDGPGTQWYVQVGGEASGRFPTEEIGMLAKRRNWAVVLALVVVPFVVSSCLIIPDQTPLQVSPPWAVDFGDPAAVPVPGGLAQVYTTGNPLVKNVATWKTSLSSGGVDGALVEALPTLPAWASTPVWAPSVRYFGYGGRYIMFYSVGYAGGGNCLGEAYSNGPGGEAGPFTPMQTRFCDPNERTPGMDTGWLDPQIFFDLNLTPWLVWSIEIPSAHTSWIEVQQLSADGTSLVGPAFQLFTYSDAAALAPGPLGRNPYVENPAVVRTRTTASTSRFRSEPGTPTGTTTRLRSPARRSAVRTSAFQAQAGRSPGSPSRPVACRTCWTARPRATTPCGHTERHRPLTTASCGQVRRGVQQQSPTDDQAPPDPACAPLEHGVSR